MSSATGSSIEHVLSNRVELQWAFAKQNDNESEYFQLRMYFMEKSDSNPFSMGFNIIAPYMKMLDSTDK